jgi:zinc protease
MLQSVRLSCTGVAILGLCSGAMAQEDRRLTPDPSLVQGDLPSGLKYMVVRHANPPGRAIMWIHVSTGSLNETDAQRGIAHYLEHMAFNGSENFPPGEVIKFFEGMGMTFGRDQNAFTSFEQTVYQLSLPDVKEETLERGLLFFKDVSGGLLLLDAEIEEERQIIIEEKTNRKGAMQRISEQMIRRVAPGSIFGERLPIGTDETLATVKRPDFLDYYTRYYVPSNMTLMVVADADPAAVIQSITKIFGTNTERKPVPADQDAKVKPYDTSFAVVVTDAEVPRAQVGIARLMKVKPPVTTMNGMRADLIDSLASQCFNRRMSDMKSRGEMAGQIMAASTGDTAGIFSEAQMISVGAPDQWKAMLNQMAAEWLRARQFGFTKSEFEQARANLIAGLEQRAEREATVPADRIIARLNNSVASGETPLSAQQMLELSKELIGTITEGDASESFAKDFDPAAVRFTLAMPPTGAPTEAELLAAGLEAFKQKVEAPSEAAGATALMERTPAPGKVESATEHAASQVTSAWLSIGVMVHHRFMDQEKNSVGVSIVLYGAELLESADTRGLSDAGSLAWGRQRATRKLSSVDIRNLMTGRKVQVGGGAGDDSLGLSISGSPQDLEVGFQLAHLLLTEPKIEPAALADWKVLQHQALEMVEKDPSALFGRLLPQAVYPDGDVRLRPLTAEQIDRVTIESAQSWIDRLIAESPIEVAIVGDISKERAIELAQTYLGSLPPRKRVSAETLLPERTLKRPATFKPVRAEIATATDKGRVFVGFYGPDGWNEADSRAMGLAAQILSSRMIQEIREKAQLVYSIRAGSSVGSTFPGFGIFSASSNTQPEKADALIAKISEMFGEFAKTGPTDEEMNVAKLQFTKSFEKNVLEADFWSAQLAQNTFLRVNLDAVLKEDELTQALTKEKVAEVFRTYYKPDQLIVVEVNPTPVK